LLENIITELGVGELMVTAGVSGHVVNVGELIVNDGKAEIAFHSARRTLRISEPKCFGAGNPNEMMTSQPAVPIDVVGDVRNSI